MVAYIFIFSVIKFVREYLSKKRGSGSGSGCKCFLFYLYYKRAICLFTKWRCELDID